MLNSLYINYDVLKNFYEGDYDQDMKKKLQDLYTNSSYYSICEVSIFKVKSKVDKFSKWFLNKIKNTNLTQTYPPIMPNMTLNEIDECDESFDDLSSRYILSESRIFERILAENPFELNNAVPSISHLFLNELFFTIIITYIMHLM
jgi:hypothetical protein